jgi:aldehyde dehydrogenase (NAD+)
MSNSQVPSFRSPDRFFIGGCWVQPATARQLEVVSPTTEEVVMRFPEASATDVERAVAAARQAFDEGPWPRLSATERGTFLTAVARELDKRLPEVAQAWTLQVGIPIAQAQYLVSQGPELFDYYGTLVPSVSFSDERPRAGGRPARVLREPVGVVGAITPWNAPLVLLVYKTAAALAAGCTVVAKPSPETPMEAYILAECIEAAGLPPGVFNLVPGGREAGEALVRHPGVDRVSFTGSTATGRAIAAACADRLAGGSFELGGKSAAVILEDADVSQVLPSLIPFSMPITGQVCFALTRVLVPESRLSELLEAYTGAMGTVVVDDPFLPTTQMGPLALERQLRRVEDYVDAGKRQGARLVMGGGRPERMKKGYFFEPTVFSQVEVGMSIAQEEIFGPVVCFLTYKDHDDAVAKANATIYGLHGAVYTRDADRGFDLARRMRSGSVTVNGLIVDPKMPFGGYKQSGLGREGGPEGLDSYLLTKTVYFG